MQKFKPELLAPAGNLEKLKIAVLYGADAVFLGGQNYGLRSKSSKMDLKTIAEGVKFAHKHNAKVYITTNIYAHNDDLLGFEEYIRKLDKIGVDAIIVSDPYYIETTKRVAPNIEIHLSTQQTVTNSQACDFYYEQGATRIVLARELNYEQIKKINKTTKAEIEIFIHGAVCSSYSGRCTLSNHMTARDSNRGGCCQSCRWDYELVEKIDNEYVAVSEKEQPFLMSAKDANLLKEIPQLFELKIDSLKVEGRNKSYHYVATVIKVYRMAIDSYYADPENFEVLPEWIEELHKAEARPTAAGSFNNDFSENTQLWQDQYQNTGWEYIGVVLEYNHKTKLALIEERNFFEVNDEIEIFGPKKHIKISKLDKIFNVEMKEINRANIPLMQIYIPVPEPVEKNYIIRKRIKP